VDVPHTFLGEAPATEASEAAFAADRAADGYVWNLTRLWAWRADFKEAFVALRSGLVDASSLSDRDKAVLNTAAAAARTDSYCSFAWAPRLASLSDAETAASVVTGEAAAGLSERESALAAWARQVVRDPGKTTQADVTRLREVGLSEREIFEATAFVALRLAFATINGALGAAPDRQLAEAAPGPVRTAITYGRPPSSHASPQ
jgi:uncharacterized peroxidase-related enzyme